MSYNFMYNNKFEMSLSQNVLIFAAYGFYLYQQIRKQNIYTAMIDIKL